MVHLIPLLSFPLLSSREPFLPEDDNLRRFPQKIEENHRNTDLDYSRRTVIEYVTNTLRTALGNQIKIWIIYKDMECCSDRVQRVEEYTYNISQTTLQVWSWHFLQ